MVLILVLVLVLFVVTARLWISRDGTPGAFLPFQQFAVSRQGITAGFVVDVRHPLDVQSSMAFDGACQGDVSGVECMCH